MEVVGGSIPLATTNFPTRCAGLTLRPPLRDRAHAFPESVPEKLMLKFGLAVVIVFLNIIS